MAVDKPYRRPTCHPTAPANRAPYPRGVGLMTDPAVTAAEFPLWSDDPALIDLLSFDAVAATAAEALLDDRLNPVALGLSGPWGSGKTTVLGLVGHELESQNTDSAKVIVVPTDPWRYDPTTGAKESLIAEVLSRLSVEVTKDETAGGKAKKLLKRLVQRVDWSKAIRLAAKTSLALQIPTFDQLTDLVKDSDEGSDEDRAPRGLEGFRSEFSELMESAELGHIRRVVVLVDDLDRCLDETIIETLEAIRLFLAVPKMSFVIAADEDRVAEAIRTRFPKSEAAGDAADGAWTEEPAKLYLHKIVQTTLPLPALSRFDTQAFLLLLQLQMRVDEAQLEPIVADCAELRRRSGDLDELAPVEGLDFSEEMAFAARLTPLLYEKLRGSPRRVKRFLNDLHVRQSIANRRGITLDAAVVAKLMVLEVLLPDEFAKVLEWLANGVLRLQMDALESAAGRPTADAAPAELEATDGEPDRDKKDKEDVPAEPAKPSFDDAMLRWAKLPPSLREPDLATYLYLAAAFRGKALLDSGLPERLRDIATNLLSAVRAEQKAVSDDELAHLGPIDAEALIAHLGRMARDRPSEQQKAVTGILRITHANADAGTAAERALSGIPADDVAIGTPLLFKLPDDAALLPVLNRWAANTTKDVVRRAVERITKAPGA